MDAAAAATYGGWIGRRWMEKDSAPMHVSKFVHMWVLVLAAIVLALLACNGCWSDRRRSKRRCSPAPNSCGNDDNCDSDSCSDNSDCSSDSDCDQDDDCSDSGDSDCSDDSDDCSDDCSSDSDSDDGCGCGCGCDCDCDCDCDCNSGGSGSGGSGTSTNGSVIETALLSAYIGFPDDSSYDVLNGLSQSGFTFLDGTQVTMTSSQSRNQRPPHMPWSASSGSGSKALIPTQSTGSTVASQNWSGYAVVSGSTSRPQVGAVTQVCASWTVPTLSAPTGTLLTQGTRTYSSSWVGIDGYSPISNTVEQLGTESDWVVGQGQVNYVWWEMYPEGAFEITGFPCNAGDSFTAYVSYKAGLTYPWQLVLINNTRRVATMINVLTRFTTTRSSAEVILEAPYSGQVLPLSNFGTETFAPTTGPSLTVSGTSFLSNVGAQATINGVVSGIADGTRSDRVVSPINMVSSATNGGYKAQVSSATNNGKNFSVQWVAAQ